MPTAAPMAGRSGMSWEVTAPDGEDTDSAALPAIPRAIFFLCVFIGCADGKGYEQKRGGKKNGQQHDTAPQLAFLNVSDDVLQYDFHKIPPLNLIFMVLRGLHICKIRLAATIGT